MKPEYSVNEGEFYSEDYGKNFRLTEDFFTTWGNGAVMWLPKGWVWNGISGRKFILRLYLTKKVNRQCKRATAKHDGIYWGHPDCRKTGDWVFWWDCCVCGLRHRMAKVMHRTLRAVGWIAWMTGKDDIRAAYEYWDLIKDREDRDKFIDWIKAPKLKEIFDGLRNS